MTVSVQDPITITTANGVTTTFPFGFKVVDADDLAVELDNVVTTSYTINDVGESTGSITITPAPASGVVVKMYRDMDATRAADYQNSGDFLARTVNIDYDRIWLYLQQLLENIGRSLRIPRGGTDYDAGGKKIENLAAATTYGGAVNKGQMDLAITSIATGLIPDTIVQTVATLAELQAMGAGLVINNKREYQGLEYTLKNDIDYTALRAADNVGYFIETTYSATAAWVADIKGRDFYVKHFGTDNNGIADDIIGINKCITACSLTGGGTVYLEDLHAKSDDIIIKQGVIVVGVSKITFVRQLPGTNRHGIVSASYRQFLLDALTPKTKDIGCKRVFIFGGNDENVLGINNTTGVGFGWHASGFVAEDIYAYGCANQGWHVVGVNAIPNSLDPTNLSREECTVNRLYVRRCGRGTVTSNGIDHLSVADWRYDNVFSSINAKYGFYTTASIEIGFLHSYSNEDWNVYFAPGCNVRALHVAARDGQRGNFYAGNTGGLRNYIGLLYCNNGGRTDNAQWSCDIDSGDMLIGELHIATPNGEPALRVRNSAGAAGGVVISGGNIDGSNFNDVDLVLTGVGTPFIPGEPVTGSVSGVGVVASGSAGTGTISINETTAFVATEVVTGGTSGATGTISTRTVIARTLVHLNRSHIDVNLQIRNAGSGSTALRTDTMSNSKVRANIKGAAAIGWRNVKGAAGVANDYNITLGTDTMTSPWSVANDPIGSEEFVKLVSTGANKIRSSFNELTTDIPTDAVGEQIRTVAHKLPYAPSAQDLNFTFIPPAAGTNSNDFVATIKVEAITTTTVQIKVRVTTASATGGSAARVAIKGRIGAW